MPSTCEVCGRRTDLIPAVGDVLRCPHCATERPFVRPPLLIVTGTAGVGKSTICARLAGTIPGAVLLDADVFALDLVSAVSPNPDYRAFWRSMIRLGHELAQNNLVVVFFSVMLPDQVLANRDVLAYFNSAHFLCLTCPPEVLHTRLVGRRSGGVTGRVGVWVEFDRAIRADAADTPNCTVLETGRGVDEVEHDVRQWINDKLAD